MKFLVFLKYLLYIEVIIVAVFITGHADVRIIVDWGDQLILSAFNGDIVNFANVLKAKGNPTNYSIFCNIFTAVSILPVYLFTKTVENIPYCMFYKFILAIFTIYSARILSDIIRFLGFNQRESILSEILYLSSMYVQPISVTYGQIDFIGNFFLICGIKYLVKNNILKSFTFFSFSYCFKPFPLIIIIPILCMIFYRIRRIVTKSIVILTIPYFVMSLITYCFIDNYYLYGSQINSSINFYNRLISYNNYFIFILILIICFVLFIKTKKLAFNNKKLLTYPLLVFSLFTLQFIHYQWELYEVASFVILIMLLLRRNIYLGIFAYVFINILQILKYLSWGGTYFVSIFDVSFYRSNLVVNFNNYIYSILNISNVNNIRICYVLCLYMFIYLANKIRMNKMILLNRQYKLVSLIFLIPMIVYFLIVYSFITFKN